MRHRNSHFIRTITITFAVLVGGIILSARAAHATLNVVTTVPDLAAIAKDIGGDRVEVRSLSLATQDPHFVDAKPSLALKVNQADLLIAVGLDLEQGWLPALQVGARNARVQVGGAGFLDCSSAITPLGKPAGSVDRSMGDIHPRGNPHYLFDPRAADACAQAIAERLAKLDSAHADEYRTRVAAFSKQLADERAAWEKRLAPYRGKSVITYHKSWVYLLDWLGLAEAATMEPKPGIAPSPRHLAEVIRIARHQDVRVSIQMGYYPKKTGTLVSKKIGGHLVSIPGGTDFQSGQTYIQHMEEVVSMLEHGFKK